MRARGVLWAVNTGRVLWHIEEGLRELKFPFEPDYVLTSEREVFHRGPDGRWQDYGDWNVRCAAGARRCSSPQRARCSPTSKHYLANHTKAHPIYEGERLIGLAAESDDEMDRVVEFLARECVRVPGFPVHAQFDLRALLPRGLQQRHGARRTRAAHRHFARSDFRRGRSLQRSADARWPARGLGRRVPGNAVDAVKRTVRDAGGYVAQGACSEGSSRRCAILEKPAS